MTKNIITPKNQFILILVAGVFIFFFFYNSIMYNRLLRIDLENKEVIDSNGGDYGEYKKTLEVFSKNVLITGVYNSVFLLKRNGLSFYYSLKSNNNGNINGISN